MTELKSVKFANSIKCGKSEYIFVSEPLFEVTLKDGVMLEVIEKKSGHKTMSSIMNAIYWEEKASAPVLVTKPIVRK